MAAALVQTIVIKASPNRVFDAISTSTGLAGFWTRDSSMTAKAGSIARFGFGDAPKLELLVDLIEPNRCVRLSSRGGSPMPPPWDGTTLTWDLTRWSSGGTEVTFTHDGWPVVMPQSELESTDATWRLVLERLKTFVETGKPVPLVS